MSLFRTLSLIIVFLLLSIPLLLAGVIDDLFLRASMMVGTLALAGRMLDAYFCPLTFESIYEYFYFLSIMNHPRDAKFHPRRTLEILSVPLKSQNTGYVIGKSVDCVFKYCIYMTIIAYFRENRPIWDPIPYRLPPQSWNDAKDYWLLGMALSSLMEIGAFIGLQMGSLFFKAPLIPLMNHIHLSTSVSDFWANRWNLVVQRILHRTVYLPLVRARSSRLVAMFLTFVFSGLVHEWTLAVMCKEKSYGEQFLFFLLQGVLIAGEVLVARYLDTSRIPWVLQVFYANTMLVATAPLFLAPFLRESLHLRLGIFLW